MAEGRMKLGLKAALCLVLLWLCLAAPAAFAGVFEDIDSALARKDYATALRLLRPLAESGDAGAQYNLGVMYAYGQGVPQDYIQAHLWLNLAAASSSQEDAEARKKAAENRDGLAAKMTPAQIAEAQRLAREWKPK